LETSRALKWVQRVCEKNLGQDSGSRLLLTKYETAIYFAMRYRNSRPETVARSFIS